MDRPETLNSSIINMRPQLNKLNLTFAIILLCLIIPFSSSAQNGKDKEKKYPALLWEISGNGVKANSYLYGTMHVSNKVAFHLSDSFFMAIQGVDKVALESDPSTWLGEMFSEDYIDEFGSQYLVRPYIRNFYKQAFSFEPHESKFLGRVISHNNYLMNGMLYRGSVINSEHEENTYLDMYIYQAGRKLGKEVIGLEDFMESQRLVEKSRKPEKDKALLRKYKKQYNKLIQSGKRPGEMLEDAYRRGDLDLLDSLQRMMNPSRNHQRYMLHVRNRIMADNMDSIMQNGKTLFSGIGSAHLAGDSGVIEMLRDMGYNLRPVTRVIGDYSRDFRDKLEKTYIDINFKTRHSSDGVFQIDLPGSLYEIPENFGLKFYFCPEMINGTQFTISRVRTRGPLMHESKEYMMKRIDSLLYENIPGKILEKEEITKNGYPAFAIKNRSRKGDHQRYLIVVTDIEMIVFKVAGTLEYLKDKEYLDRVFNSIKIHRPNKDWETYEPEFGSFAVDLPSNFLQEDENPLIKSLVSSRKIVQGFDPTDSSYYYVGRIGLHDYDYIEEDTFELSYMAEKLIKQRKMNELNREFKQINDQPALDITCKDSTRFSHLRFVVQGPRYFMMLAQTDDSVAPEKFFNSFKIKELKYPNGFKDYTDTNLYYSVRTVIDPVKKPDYMSYYRYMSSDEDEDKSHERETKLTRFINNQTDEKITVKFTKFHRYTSFPSLDSLWNYQVEDVNEGTMAVRQKTISKDSMQMELQFVDTNSNRLIDLKYMLNAGVLYRLSSQTDTITGRTQFVDTFYSSFTPSTDTIIGISPTINKTDLMFEHLFGDDSTKREQAMSSFSSMRLKDKHFDQAVRMFETFEHEDFDLYTRSNLLSELGTLKNKNAIPYLKKVFRASVDTPLLQTAALEALVDRQEKNSIAIFKSLLADETPLLNENTIYYMMNGLRDSLELNKPLYPFLFEFTRYPEYKEVVYGTFRDMLDSNVVSRKDFKSQKKMILRDAKDELKRQVAKNSSNTSHVDGYITYYYGNYALLDLCRILLEFCSDPEVQEFYDRIDRSNNLTLRMQKDVLMLKHDEPVSDTVWNFYASKPNYRKQLYYRLKHLKRLDLFPKEYLNQEDMIWASMYGYEDVDPTDSASFLFKKEAIYKGEKGYIYFFKHKDNYNDEEWNIDYYGVQPLDSTKFELDNNVSDTDIDIDLEDQEEVDKKIEEILDQVKYQHRQRVVPERRNPYYSPYGY